MINPGTYALFSGAITAALTADDQTPITGLEGMSAVTLEARFQYGSGGTTCIATVQTTINGTNWIDIARFDFATTSAAKQCNLSGMLSKGITAVAALSSESVYDSVLGEKLRVIITSTGTYANTTLAIWASVR